MPWQIWLAAGLVADAVLAVIPAVVARDRGRPAGAFYALGLLAVVPALLVALLLPPREGRVPRGGLGDLALTCLAFGIGLPALLLTGYALTA